MTSPSSVLWGLLGAPSAGLASPSPEPAEVVRTPPPELVTPGTLGFLVTFGVAVALVFLVRDMVRRNRGLVVRAERRDAELRAQAEAVTQDGGGHGGGHGGGPDGVPGTRPVQRSTPRDREGPDRQGPAAPIG